MQSRRRNFADRFSPAGIGPGQPEYRKFGRGGGSRRRGPHDSPPPLPHLTAPPPPPRRQAEVLREAGRLAAEYLAAKGLLHPNPVSSSAGTERWWPNEGEEEVDRTSAFSRLGHRRLDGDDNGFRTRKRVRRRRHRSESYRRHGSDWGREDVGAPHWGKDYPDAMDADDLERPLRWPARERRFFDPVDDGESDRRSFSEESDRGNGSLVERKTQKSAPDYDHVRPSKDEASDNESGSNAMESSERKPHPHPAPVPETNSIRKPDEAKDAQKTSKGSDETAIGGDQPHEKELQKVEDEELTAKNRSGQDNQMKSGGNGQLPISDETSVLPRSSDGSKNTETDRKRDRDEFKENADELNDSAELSNSDLAPSNAALTGVSPSTALSKTDDFLKQLDIPVEQSHLSSSSSFKICDLNAIEDPDMTSASTPAFATPLERENSFGVIFGQKSNDPIIINLEDDSAEGCCAGDASESKSEPVCPTLDNFMNQQGNPVDLDGIQDGYGLSISEFLANDIQSCSAGQEGMGNLGTFPDAEGISGNDDPLFMSIGDIPINFMDVWDQPPSEYGKFF